MHCASCASLIERTLNENKDIVKINVNYSTEKAIIETKNPEFDFNALNKKIEKYGYKLYKERESSKTNAQSKYKIFSLLFISLFVFGAMMWEIGEKLELSFVPPFPISMELHGWILFALALLVMILGGKQFLLSIGNFFKYRVATMDTLVGIGTTTAFFYSTFILFLPEIATRWGLPMDKYFDVTIVVICFVIFGKYLESKSKEKTGFAIQKLIALQSTTAIVEREEKEIEIPVEQLKVNDIVIVKPGAKIPVDGIITEGFSSINESAITGEPIAVDKTVGDKVIGSTINKQGFIKFRATKVGDETVLANIIKMVEDAQNSKAPIQKLVDKIASVFVPVVLIIALVSFLTWLIIGSFFIPIDEAFKYAILNFIAVLVIACPCALGLATPTAIVVGVGKGAENGILIKNAESFEKLQKIDTIVFDKTGTITNGKPVLTDIIVIHDPDIMDKNQILQIAASIETKSEHPLAMAFLDKAKNLEKYNVEDFKYIEGKGIEARINKSSFILGNKKIIEEYNIDYPSNILENLTKEGKTPVFLARNKKVIAIFGIADTLKDNASKTIKKLQDRGFAIYLLSGDNKNTVEYIANKAGIDNSISEVLPSDKANIIKKLQGEGRVIAMVGDGINDAPALVQSDVGIAMSNGTDIAIDSASFVLLGGDIGKIFKLIFLSKLTMTTIKQNLFWAFIYNIIGIPLAAGVFYPIWGIMLNPVFAGLAMAFSSLSVVTNSLTLKFKNLNN